MSTTKLAKNLLRCLTALAGLTLPFSWAGSSVSVLQGNRAYIEEVRPLDTNDLGLLNPAGLAFSPEANVFFILEAHSTSQADIVTMTPFEDFVGSVSVNVTIMDPINMAFDSQANRLLLFDTASSEVIEIKAGPDGYLNSSPEAITRFQVGQLGLQDPQGMTIDVAKGHLLVLDSSALQVVRIEPDSQGGFDGPAALNEARVSQVDLRQAGLVDPRGLAFNPTNGHVYLLSPVQQELYELTETGQVVGTLDLSPFEFVDPQGLVFASSGDLTDDPSIINLYIADTGLSAGLSRAAACPEVNKAGQELGRVIELSLTLPVPIISAVDTVQATLERTTDTSQSSPPSPDPSGLAYSPHSGRLMTSDGEVNEMPQYFTDDNLFEATLSGSLIDTPTTISFSDEPTGIAYDPFDDHLFFSDASAVDTAADFSAAGTYVLRLTADDEELTAGDEAAIAASFRFVSWADTKSALDELASLSTQAVLLNPTFTIYVGDLESNGFTLSGMNAWKDAMNGYCDNGMFDITLPVRGNHDADDTSGWQSYYDLQSTAPGVGATNYSALDEDLTYSLDYGNSHFIGVDVLGNADHLSPEQVSWIDNDLAAAEARGLTHAFVYFHGPIYCVGGHCSCTRRTCSLDPVVVNLIEVFNEHPIVSATFHGHEHTYAHVHIDDTRIPEVTHPFEQFVTGSAGVDPNDCILGRTDYCMPSNGFVTVDVSGNSFTVDFYELGTTSSVKTMTFTKSWNQSPSVDAGSDQTVTLPDSAFLDGTVTDDVSPDPPGMVTTTWSQGSGSGVVTFTDPYTVDTTADFSEADTYVLRLTADDGELTASDEVTVVVIEKVIYLPLIFKDFLPKW
jgi:hypothetical protein